MARPTKSPEDRKTGELRIRVRPETKVKVSEIAAAQFLDEASWVRSLVERAIHDFQLLSHTR